MTETILVLAPHPDDEVLGCGGFIKKRAEEGAKIIIAIMTNGNIGAPELFPIEGTKRGRSEAIKSHEVLGAHKTYFFDFPAPRLDAFPSYKISIEIGKLISKYKVNTLLLPHRGDIHKDHRIVYECGLVAARPNAQHKVTKIMAYETLSETEWAPPFADDAFIPTVFCELSEIHLKAKIDAFECFTEPRLKHYPHSRSSDGLNTLARYRGSIISKPYAESFMLIREIMLL